PEKNCCLSISPLINSPLRSSTRSERQRMALSRLSLHPFATLLLSPSSQSQVFRFRFLIARGTISGCSAFIIASANVTRSAAWLVPLKVPHLPEPTVRDCPDP